MNGELKSCFKCKSDNVTISRSKHGAHGKCLDCFAKSMFHPVALAKTIHTATRWALQSWNAVARD